MLLDVAEHRHPHRRHTGCQGHLLGSEKLTDAWWIQARARQDKFDPQHRGNERQAPAVDMKHRNDRQSSIALPNTEIVGRCDDN